MVWDQDDFNEYVLSNNVIGFFEEPITLKSGRVSNWYVNWRNPAENVRLISQLADYVIEFVLSKGLEPASFYGVPEGATKLGVITQFKWALSRPDSLDKDYFLSMGRGSPKEHGQPKDRYFLGVPQGKTVVLEDVTTTGTSLENEIKRLKEAEVEVIAAIGLTHRNELRDDNRKVADLIKEYDVPYYAMSNAFELLPIKIKRDKPSGDIVSKVQQYFLEYGERNLSV
jgi:orotate phosphoribosyltransferase